MVVRNKMFEILVALELFVCLSPGLRFSLKWSVSRRLFIQFISGGSGCDVPTKLTIFNITLCSS